MTGVLRRRVAAAAVAAVGHGRRSLQHIRAKGLQGLVRNFRRAELGDDRKGERQRLGRVGIESPHGSRRVQQARAARRTGERKHGTPAVVSDASAPYFSSDTMPKSK